MKARALISWAPLPKRLRVAARAANEQDEEAKPKAIASPSCGGEALPRCFAASRRDRKTWMPAEIARCTRPFPGG